MKSFLLFPILILASLGLFQAQGEDAHTLRVLCYNIHYGQGNDGVYDLERLAKVIRDTKPDLVALQEVDVVVERSGKVHQARKLGELTGMAVRYGPTQHYQGGLYGNAVLTKLPILDVEIQPLPYSEATPERTTYPRGAIAVTVSAPDGKPLRFISTHFQHNVEEDRVEQAKKINALFAGENQVRSVLAGDINATPDSEPVRILLESWTTLLESPPAPSAPSKNPTSRIDYIFTRTGAGLVIRKSEVIDEPMASDHCPIYAEIELKDE